MSLIQCIALIVLLDSLTGLASAQVPATNPPAMNQAINIRNVGISDVLKIYHDVTRLQLSISSAVLQDKRTITLVGTAHSPAEIQALIEQALLKQTGISITKTDGKHASVEYRAKPAEVK
jgi:hypothetical protein